MLLELDASRNWSFQSSGAEAYLASSFFLTPSLQVLSFSPVINYPKNNNQKSLTQLTSCLQAIDHKHAFSSISLPPLLFSFSRFHFNLQRPPTADLVTNHLTMAPTKTAAKGRGRPRRSDAGDAAAVESPPAAAATDDTPRRRGRPKSSESGVSNAKVKKPSTYVPTGRPRGRPPGSGKKATKPPYVPTGRPRGRPPGSGSKAKAEPATKKGTTVARGGPKGRKSDVAKAKEADDDDEEEGMRRRSSARTST
ncbi:hypothetical protein F5883DRAFT_46414 [Diaporthe sp. PMI_573]|nr:hypothetical protein F5883DRAFT_46414 [Diaporthaceae sp. PMI_573]